LSFTEDESLPGFNGDARRGLVQGNVNRPHLALMGF